MADLENRSVADNNEQNINDEAWNKKDFAILGGVLVFFIIGMITALNMDVIVLAIKDKMEVAKLEKIEKQNNERQKAEEEPEVQIDFTKNMKEINRKIKKNWHPPKVLPKKSTVVEFGVNKKGVVTAAAVSESCGDPDIDKLAVEAVEKSSPFKPLPKEFKGDGVRIRFKFDFDASFERPKEQ